MHSITLSGKINHTISFPSEWNELTTPDLEIVSQALIGNFESAELAQAFLFTGLLKQRLPGPEKQKNGIIKKLDPEQCFLQGLPALEFIFKENTLTKQPYPVLDLSPLTFHLKGPADDFDSITCAEFEESEIHYMQFLETKDPAHLAALAATLYRPEGARYVTFDAANNDYIIYESETLAPTLLKLPPHVLYSIFLWYSGCREQLPIYFPKCFETSGVKAAPDPMIFTKLIHAAAGVKNGDRNQVRRTALKEIFMDLELEKLSAAEQPAT